MCELKCTFLYFNKSAIPYLHSFHITHLRQPLGRVTACGGEPESFSLDAFQNTHMESEQLHRI